MCKDCGCEQGGPVGINGAPANHVHSRLLGHPAPHDHPGSAPHDSGLDPAHGSSQGHSHGPSHESPPPPLHVSAADTSAPPRALEVNQSILQHNDRLAERNRGFFKAKGLLTLNVVSSPGSGKTTLIRETILRLRGRLRVGVIVGDLATENDALRLRETGAPAVQITTGTLCHLEAELIARALTQLDLNALDLLVIENVGNLVCPAAYDLGEDLRVAVLSVTEGEDKPLKYPPLFHSAHVVLVNKIDLAETTGFNRSAALAAVQRVSHHARIFELSARTGAGLEAWCDYLVAAHAQAGI